MKIKKHYSDGSWYIEKQEKTGYYIIRDLNGQNVAIINDVSVDEWTAKANTKLIRASTDLADMLVEALDFIQSTRPDASGIADKIAAVLSNAGVEIIPDPKK